MNEPINVVRLRHPDDVDDPLTEVLRAGARRLLAQAVELEAEAILAGMQDLKLMRAWPLSRSRWVSTSPAPASANRRSISVRSLGWLALTASRSWAPACRIVVAMAGLSRAGSPLTGRFFLTGIAASDSAK